MRTRGGGGAHNSQNSEIFENLKRFYIKKFVVKKNRFCKKKNSKMYKNVHAFSGEEVTNRSTISRLLFEKSFAKKVL